LRCNRALALSPQLPLGGRTLSKQNCQKTLGLLIRNEWPATYEWTFALFRDGKFDEFPNDFSRIPFEFCVPFEGEATALPHRIGRTNSVGKTSNALRKGLICSGSCPTRSGVASFAQEVVQCAQEVFPTELPTS
jgi:hypothetical protein